VVNPPRRRCLPVAACPDWCESRGQPFAVFFAGVFEFAGGLEFAGAFEAGLAAALEAGFAAAAFATGAFAAAAFATGALAAVAFVAGALVVDPFGPAFVAAALAGALATGARPAGVAEPLLEAAVAVSAPSPRVVRWSAARAMPAAVWAPFAMSALPAAIRALAAFWAWVLLTV